MQRIAKKKKKKETGLFSCLLFEIFEQINNDSIWLSQFQNKTSFRQWLYEKISYENMFAQEAYSSQNYYAAQKNQLNANSCF